MAQTLCFVSGLFAPSSLAIVASHGLSQASARFTPCILSAPSRFLPLSKASSGSSNRAFSPPRSASDGVEVKTSIPELQSDNILSGEWPQNFSMLNYEDLSAHYESIVFKAEAQPDTFLADVMSTTIYTGRPTQLLEEVDHLFSIVSGLPVIDEGLRCIGVLSKKDRSKALNGLKSKIGEVMSSPAITLSADKTVQDAAILMLKNKIHRIPIVNAEQQVVGMVTRTDIFTALEGGL